MEMVDRGGQWLVSIIRCVPYDDQGVGEMLENTTITTTK